MRVFANTLYIVGDEDGLSGLKSTATATTIWRPLRTVHFVV